LASLEAGFIPLEGIFTNKSTLIILPLVGIMMPLEHVMMLLIMTIF